jgi:hypothetical protein
MATLDESWFCLKVDQELIWFQWDEEIPERQQHTVQSDKVIAVIVWNPSGFHLIEFIPKGFKFNMGYYGAQILDQLSV